MSGVPHSLSLSPVTNNPQLEPPKALLTKGRAGLVVEYALKGREASGDIPEGILYILGPVVVPLAVCLEVTSEFPDLALSLAIRLGMVTRRQAHHDPQ